MAGAIKAIKNRIADQENIIGRGPDRKDSVNLSSTEEIFP